MASSIVVVLIHVAVVGAGTLAVFGTGGAGGANAFPTAAVGLERDRPVEVRLEGGPPGAAVREEIVLTNDDGRSALRYAASSSSGTPDGDGRALRPSLTIKTGVAGTSCSGFDSSGTTVYAGDLVPSGGVLLTDRRLAVGGSDVLCLRVESPSPGTAGRAAGTPTATLSFQAEPVGRPR